MRYDDHGDPAVEGLLRRALADEAETVHPAGDGLSRIQDRVAARRRRARWLRPAAVVGTAAMLAAGAIVGVTVANRSGGRETIHVATPSPSSASPSPSPSVSPVVTGPRFPARAIYPFTSAAQERSWEAGTAPDASTVAANDPKAVALAFAQQFLGEPSLTLVTDTVLAPSGTTATVTLGRILQAETRRTIDVTKVQLVTFGKAWLVVGADDAGGLLTVSAPTAGASAGSPVTVSGPGFGVEESVGVQVRSTQDGPLGAVAHVSFGNGTPQWSTAVTFRTPTDPTAAVVVTDVSLADGLPGRITVVPIRTGTTGPAYPAQFVGIKDGRVTVFDSQTGKPLTGLTTKQAGGGASDPQVEGATVYYLQGAGTCSNAVPKSVLMSVPLAGGAAQPVASPDSGYSITSYAVTADGSRRASFETACAGATQPSGKLVVDAAGQRTTVATFPSFPPMLVGDPSWEPDGVHLDGFVRGGNEGSLTRYDTSAPSQPQSGMCLAASLEPGTALETDATGTVWFTYFTGSATQVRRCLNNTSTVAFTVTSQPPADLDVTSDGSAALLTDSAGHVWRWSAGSKPVRLETVGPVTQVSW